jgi:hypothetical protein
MNERGDALSSMVVGAGLGLLALLSALALARGLAQLTTRVQEREAARVAARWSLDQMASLFLLSGQGVCPGDEPNCPDEAIELLDDHALALRGDLDRDRPGEQDQPERELAGLFPSVPTANDEVVVFLRRSASRDPNVSFEADLDSTDQATLPDGTPVARRDGRVESIDGGAAQTVDDQRAGTLYRISYSHDARLFGRGTSRITEPLADDVTLLRFQGFDRAGGPVSACGGTQTLAAQSCRQRVARLRIDLRIRTRSGDEVELSREVARAVGP